METNEIEHLQLGMAVHCLREALEKVLLQLAVYHGDRAGAWLDNLEQQVIKDTENTDFRTPLDLDTKVTKAALTYVI